MKHLSYSLSISYNCYKPVDPTALRLNFDAGIRKFVRNGVNAWKLTWQKHIDIHKKP